MTVIVPFFGGDGKQVKAALSPAGKSGLTSYRVSE
jgi:hypothetical protein